MNSPTIGPTCPDLEMGGTIDVTEKVLAFAKKCGTGPLGTLVGDPHHNQ